MPMMRANVIELNRQFQPENIQDFAKHAEAFAPGRSLDAGLLMRMGPKEQRAFQAYLDQLPGSFKEVLRSVLHYALSSKTPVPVIFNWVPAYDFELSVWEGECGVSVTLKGRYPGDRRPKVDEAG